MLIKTNSTEKRQKTLLAWSVGENTRHFESLLINQSRLCGKQGHKKLGLKARQLSQDTLWWSFIDGLIRCRIILCPDINKPGVRFIEFVLEHPSQLVTKNYRILSIFPLLYQTRLLWTCRLWDRCCTKFDVLDDDGALIALVWTTWKTQRRLVYLTCTLPPWRIADIFTRSWDRA